MDFGADDWVEVSVTKLRGYGTRHGPDLNPSKQAAQPWTSSRGGHDIFTSYSPGRRDCRYRPDENVGLRSLTKMCAPSTRGPSAGVFRFGQTGSMPPTRPDQIAQGARLASVTEKPGEGLVRLAQI